MWSRSSVGPPPRVLEGVDADNLDDEPGERLVNPSKNIKYDLISALEMKATEVLESKFGVSKTYEDAPDPDLRVAGFGNVALPLTEEKARELVQVCHQAPYGKKEQTLVDTSVRDTWEIDADRVLFKNPLWQKWLKSVVVNTVAKQLGVASISGWELYKMLLYQEGSHFLPHQDTEKSPGMVATIIVVLPSAFEGGEVHLSHNGTKKILDVATSSSTATSVLAWYSDVRHEVKPITSGYRLALSYNLMIPIGVPQPDVAGNSKMMAAVRHVLLSWKQSFGPQIPNKLACVLDHEYSLNGLQSGAFKGDDIRTVEVLWKLAQECGFKLHFAKAEYIAVRNAIHTPNGDCDAGEDISTEINLHNVLDADAKPVKLVGSASYFDGDDFFPRDLDDDDPDDEQYEEYTGNAGDEFTFWYSTTVVLLWPNNRHYDVQGRNWLDYACAELSSSTPTSATPKEKKLVDRIMYRVQGGAPEKALDQVSAAALRWKDDELLLRIDGLRSAKSATAATKRAMPSSTSGQPTKRKKNTK